MNQTKVEMRHLNILRHILLATIGLVAFACARPAAAQSQPSGAMVHGRIYDAAGNPASSATVWEVDAGSASLVPVTKVIGQAQSSADGAYALQFGRSPELSDAKHSSTQVIAAIPSQGLSVPAEIEPGSDEPLRLMPRADLHVSVVDESGHATSGVELRPSLIVFNAEGGAPVRFQLPDEISQRWSATTDATGQVVFHGLPVHADVSIVSDDPRYAQIESHFGIELAENVNDYTCQLQPACQLRGRLECDVARAPVGSVPIEINSTGDTPRVNELLRTDATGGFVSSRLPAGSYVVQLGGAYPRDQWTAKPILVAVKPGEAATPELLMTHGAVVQGRLREGGTDHPLVGASMYFTWSGEDQLFDSAHVTTSADGSFAVHVAPGKLTMGATVSGLTGYLRLEGSPGGGMMKEQTVADGQTVQWDIDLSVDPRPLVRGTVVGPDGRPVARAHVTLRGGTRTPGQRLSARGEPESYTDETGRFVILLSSRGAYLRAQKNDLGTLKPVNVDGAMDGLTLKLQPNATYALAVHIVDDQNRPIGGASVAMIDRTDGPGIASPVPADGSGTLKFPYILRDTYQFLSVSASGYGPASNVLPPDPAGAAQREIIVRLPTATSVIAGVVVDAEGKAASKIQVILSGGTAGVARTLTDSTGRFSFAVVPGATGRLSARSSTGGLTQLSAVAGQADIELKLASPILGTP